MKLATRRVKIAGELYKAVFYRKLYITLLHTQDLSEADTRLQNALGNSIDEILEVLRPAWDELHEQSIASPEDFPFTAKPEFFDQTLVQLIDTHLRRETYEAFRTDLLDAIAKQYADSVVTASSARGPADYELVSGVREQPYHVDENLSFLKPPADDEKALFFPFEFVVQTVFNTLPMRFLGRSDDSVMLHQAREFVDDKPWQFPRLSGGNRIERLLRDHVVTGSDRLVLDNMRHFALLQRVFRLAFAGQLGIEFPLGKLLSLQTLVTRPGGYEPTPVWRDAPPEWWLSNYLRKLETEASLSPISSEDDSE